MNDRDGGVRSRGTTTTLRVDRPDGSVSETVRDDCGRVTTTRIGSDGAVLARFVADIRPDGVVIVNRSVDGEEPVQLLPRSITNHTNPYGTTIERLEFEGLSIDNTFDDDGKLRTVSMRGDWGEQSTELRPDGGRTMRWDTGLHHGTQTWTSSGELDHYDLSCSDGTRYQYDRVGRGGRTTVVGWDGHTEVIRNTSSSAGQGRAS